MKFFAVAATFVAAAAASYGYEPLPVEECSAIVTVTTTVTLPYGQHTPVVPGVPATSAPYPTTEAYPPAPPAGTGYPAPPAPPAAGTGYPMPPAPPAGTGYPMPPAPPAGTGYPVPYPTGTGAPKPSGTGVYHPGYPEFTGAASSINVGGFVAGVGAIAAMFL